MKNAKLLAVLVACLVGGGASAALTPDSYNMPNGNTGSFQYWDQTYSGAGCVTCDNAALTGGKGDLTDGIIASGNWFVVEAPAGNGPYVGWTLNPTITFHWNSAVSINSVTFYLDDADGAGGVNAPESIVIDGNIFNVAEPAGSAPFSYTASGLSFSGTDLVVTLQRKNQWVFLSEVEFAGAQAVPEPETLALVMVGLGTMVMCTRRRKRL